MKKVLSFVLVLTLVLGSFSMAFAATEHAALNDVVGNANESAITVVNDLGIVTGYTDGSFKPAQNVTRAEYAAMMTRALNIPESALNGFKTSAFTDVTADHWAVAYLGYCNSKGIMTGYEDGTARPNQTITVNEAMTMIVRALGYTADAKEIVGTWPANYISLAQKLGLYDDMSASGIVDRANAAQIIYNALDETLVYVDADGVTQPQRGANTMLQLLKGNVAMTNGYEEKVLTTADARNAVVNVMNYVGNKVKAYVNKDGDIIAIDVLSTTLTGEFNADGDFELADGTVYTFNGGLNANAGFLGYTLTDARGNSEDFTPSAIVNGQTYDAFGTASMGAIVTSDAVTMAVKVSGKTIKEVYSVQKWEADAEFLYDDEFDAEDFEFADFNLKKNNDNEIDTNYFALNGATSLDKIAKDSVVTVYTDGRYVVRVDVSTATVNGKITENDGSKYYIDGTKYYETGNLDAALGDGLEVGSTGKFFLNYDGDITKFVADDATTGNYAIVLGIDEDTDLRGNTTTTVALFTKDGDDKDYTMAKNKAVDGGVTIGSIVRYSFDKDGKIDTNLTKVTPAAVVGAKIDKNETRLGNAKLATNVVVFMKDGTDWELGTVSQIDKEYAFAGLQNDFVIKNATNNKIEVIVIGNKATALGTDSVYGVINKVTSRDDDGTTREYVTGFLGADTLAAFSKAAMGTRTKAPAPASGGGLGLYEIDVNAEGYITGADNVTASSVAAVTTVKAIDTTNKTIESGFDGSIYQLSDDAVIYLWKDDAFTKVELGKVTKKHTVALFSLSDDAQDDNEIDYVIAW